MSFDDATRRLKAAADPSRLRLLALVARGEATVGELQGLLGQSQPRVSRHLRLLTEAGLVERFRDGHWVYYRLATAPADRALVDAALALVDPADPARIADARARDELEPERRRRAFASGPARIATLPLPRPGAAELEEALAELLDGAGVDTALDVGCGGGTLLRLLADHAGHVVGLDRSPEMRLLSRARLEQWGLAACTVRAGEAAALPFGPGSFDLVVLDEVLATAAQPAALVAEALRVLGPRGRLVVLDRIEPAAVRLGPRGGLAENQLTALLAGAGAPVRARYWFPGPALAYAAFAAARAPRLVHGPQPGPSLAGERQ